MTPSPWKINIDSLLGTYTANLKIVTVKDIEESHPAWFIDLFLVVQDSVFPWKVQELQDNSQPSKQICQDISFAFDEIFPDEL